MQVACNTSEAVQKQLIAADTEANEAVKAYLDDLESGAAAAGGGGGSGSGGVGISSPPFVGQADGVAPGSRQLRVSEPSLGGGGGVSM